MFDSRTPPLKNPGYAPVFITFNQEISLALTQSGGGTAYRHSWSLTEISFKFGAHEGTRPRPATSPWSQFHTTGPFE